MRARLLVFLAMMAGTAFGGCTLPELSTSPTCGMPTTARLPPSTAEDPFSIDVNHFAEGDDQVVWQWSLETPLACNDQHVKVESSVFVADEGAYCPPGAAEVTLKGVAGPTQGYVQVGQANPRENGSYYDDNVEVGMAQFNQPYNVTAYLNVALPSVGDAAHDLACAKDRIQQLAIEIKYLPYAEPSG